jgi:hypothetical protein
VFKDIAVPMIERGVPVTPLRPRSKIAVLDGWQDSASTDLGQIILWDKEWPDGNCASVARAQLGYVWFFEIDRPEVTARIESETGQKMPRTFRVRSSPGRGHFYFKQNAQSLAMGNLAQGFVKGGDWSARVDRQYVVSPGSIHPKTGEPYIVASKADIIEAPDWLIKWLISQKIERKPAVKNVFDDGEIITGARNTTLTSIAGRMRQVMKATEEQLYDYLINVNETRCAPPLDESEIRTISHSVGGYPVKDDTVLIGGKPAGSFVSTTPASVPSDPATTVEPPEFKPLIYPKFPLWAIQNTSIYDGLCRPLCEANPSIYPEYLWMSAMLIMLNYLGTKVTVPMTDSRWSLFVIMIGRPGETFKSGSFGQAKRYLETAGICEESSSGTRAAQGKSLIWTAGSPEGLGLSMQRTQCKNAILFYDELETLVKKASIESSNLRAAILTLYESQLFQNEIKSRKETYSHGEGTYCASLIACCPDKKFTELWGRLGGKDTGLDSRAFFLFQPEVLKESKLLRLVSTFDGAQETKRRIDKAVNQRVYEFEDATSIDGITGRAAVRAQKFALGFAVDKGIDIIDADCCERAAAIIEYEKAVKSYFGSFESGTKDGIIQQTIMHKLRQRNGVMTERELKREMHPLKHGTFLWGNAYNGLLRNGWIREEGDGTKGSPKLIRMMQNVEDED